MNSFPALVLLLQLCCAAKLITLVDDGSPRGRANGLLYHETWALCCAPSFFMALTVFGALHVLLSETFTGAQNNPYPAGKASSWFHLHDWMRTWIVTCPTMSIDVAQLVGCSFCFVLLQDSAGIAVGGAEAEVGCVDRRSYGSFGRRIAGF